MKHEQIARELKSSGKNCSYSLYTAFKDDYKLKEEYPLPRSIDGKCGALLTTEHILKQLGKEEYIPEYEKMFLEQFGYIKCLDLLKNTKRCNDYVGFSADFLDKVLKEK